MAPALTQASDPQTFHVAAHQHSPGRPGEAPATHASPPPTAHLALQYGGLKEPHDCTDAHLAAALTNGTRRARLLPPSPPSVGGLACGREGSHPPPRPHAAHTTMDPQLGVPPLSEAGTTTQSSSESSTIITTITTTTATTTTATSMGQDTCPQPTATSMGQDTNPQPSTANHHVQDNTGSKMPKPLPQDGDLFSLIGRDFVNMNEIIDTLTRLADNPEVLAAVDTAALALQNQSDVGQQHLEGESLERQVPKEERAQLMIDDLSRRQYQIERRQARLLRRLRRVTARGLGASVSGQLRELLEHAHVSLAQQRERSAPSEEGPAPTTTPEVGVESLRADAMRAMSTSALVNLVRRVEASQGLARLAAASQRPAKSQVVTPSPCLPDHSRVEVTTVTAEVRAAAHAHTNHDSDATESSSGGESCDELEAYNDTNNTHYIPTRERAYNRYCRARSWIASRWTWVQSQVADLEYRILQQQKIYTHVRNTKGAVQLDESTRWRGMSYRDPAHLDPHDPALTCLSTSTTRTTVNGYHSHRVEDLGSECGSARTQGIRNIKRRRLVRAGAGLCAGHRRGGGGGRIPAVHCKCVPPLTCVLCTRLQGAVPPAAPPDPDTQPSSERHARVDPTFHPVLSQPADVSLSERFDAMLKTTEWQRHVLTAKTIQAPVVTRPNREPIHAEKKKKDKDRKKDNKKHKKEGKGRITLKLRKSLLTGELVRDGDFKKKRMSARDALLSIKRARIEDDDDASSLYVSSLHSSPSASPAPVDRSASKKPSSHSSQKNKPTTNSNSYDIDNIVIPYSMAASTRVEKLAYKEIPTPGWRVVPLLPNNLHKATSQDDESEDVSEDAVIARHNRSEELERKKFLQYLQMQVTTRSTRSRRTDSSGTNTPDHPLSPRLPDPASDTISPLATPPSTPLAPSEDSNQSSNILIITSVPNSSSYPLSSTPVSSTISSQSTFVNSSSQLSNLTNTSQLVPNQFISHSSQLDEHSCTPQSASTQQLTSVPLTSSNTSLLSDHAPLSTPSSLSISTSNSILPSSTTLASSSSTLSSLLMAGNRRNRTLSSSSSRNRGYFSLEEGGFIERLEGVLPYDKRVFPLKEYEYTNMTREMENCDIGPLSPPFDASTHDRNSIAESGRSSPMSEVTDSAPEDEAQFDDSAPPKWTISGLKDATGQCVLQIHRN